MSDRLLYRISEAAQILGLSRSKLYELVSKGEIKVVRVGSAPRVTADELRQFVARLTEEATGTR